MTEYETTIERNYCVYIHTSPSGKRYVGITGRNPIERWRNGWGYRENEHFWRAIVKYGWDNFKHEIIATDLAHDEAIALEIENVAKYKTNDSDFGYNKTVGGEGCNGTPRSEETKQKLREKCRGWTHSDEAKAKIGQRARECWTDPEYRRVVIEKHSGENAYWYGREVPKERLEKQRQKMLGRKLSEEHKAKLRASARRGKDNPNYGGRYSNLRLDEMSRLMTERMKNPSLRKHLQEVIPHKPVVQLTLDGVEITVFESASEAQKQAGLDKRNISLCCRGSRKSAYGYVWRYKDEVME